MPTNSRSSLSSRQTKAHAPRVVESSESILNLRGVAGGIAVATLCIYIQSGRWQSNNSDQMSGGLRQLPPDGGLPRDLQVLIVCNRRCRGKTTREHMRRAEAAREEFETQNWDPNDWPIFVEEICVYDCREELESKPNSINESSWKNFNDYPELQHYFECSVSCRERLKASLILNEEELTASLLRECRVAHFPLGFHIGTTGEGEFSTLAALMLQEQTALLNSARAGQQPEKDLLDGRFLRGREELWVPFRRPFDQFSTFLLDAGLRKAVIRYFNDRGMGVVDHVQVLNAKGQGLSRRQELHRDAGEQTTGHLEIHIPLLKGLGIVPAEMGPTRFCPCAHKFINATDPVSYAIRQYFINEEMCTVYPEFHWVLSDDLVGNASQVWATAYDSQVFHQGLENISPHDRPLLAIALAESREAVDSRNYLEQRSPLQVEAAKQFREVVL